MRDRLVAGNWKMHGNRASNRALLDAVLAGLGALRRASNARSACRFPISARWRPSVQGRRGSRWGAQNLSEHAQGAFTGEVSAAMLAEFGCRYVLVGHSERRQLYGETDAVVAAKFAAAQAQGMTPILCVGETLAEREAGSTEEVVARQLEAVISLNGKDSFEDAVVAYEPVWAIGTGRTATPEQAQAVHAFLRGQAARGDAPAVRRQREGGECGGAVRACRTWMAD